jgi:hypothetical protein
VADQPAATLVDQYMSADVHIFVQQTGNMVIAVESFDEETAKRLMEAGLKGEQAHTKL